MIASFVEKARRLYPTSDSMSTDRGYWSSRNRAKLDKILAVSALPKNGGKSKADRARESAPDFAEARRQHPAIESAIHNLNHRGLKRVRTHGMEGFVRTVALGVVGAQRPPTGTNRQGAVEAVRGVASGTPNGGVTSPSGTRIDGQKIAKTFGSASYRHARSRKSRLELAQTRLSVSTSSDLRSRPHNRASQWTLQTHPKACRSTLRIWQISFFWQTQIRYARSREYHRLGPLKVHPGDMQRFGKEFWVCVYFMRNRDDMVRDCFFFVIKVVYSLVVRPYPVIRRNV